MWTYYERGQRPGSWWRHHPRTPPHRRQQTAANGREGGAGREQQVSLVSFCFDQFLLNENYVNADGLENK